MICTNKVETMINTYDNTYYIIPENYSESKQLNSILSILEKENVTAFFSLVMINNVMIEIIRITCGLLQFLVIISLLKTHKEFNIKYNIT